MWRYFFYFSLCLTTLRCENQSDERLLKLKAAAGGLDIKTTRSDDYTVDFYIKGNKRCHVFIYDPINVDNRSYKTGASDKLYACMGCTFAAWTRNELISFVDRYPALYSAEFVSKLNYQFRGGFAASVKTLDRIAEKTQLFMDILFNFVAINSFDSLIDTDLLKTLVSINLKLKFLKTPLFGVEHLSSKNDRTDDVVIGLILELVNDIQSYLFVNCELTFPRDNRIFYGYSTNGDEPNNVEIDTFLEDIGGLDLSAERCGLNEMLLLDFSSSAEKRIARGVSAAQIHLGCREKVSLESVMGKIKISFGPEEILWYLQKVFDIIMKLVSTKIVKHFEGSNVLPAETANAIATIYSRFAFAIDRLPLSVIMRLSILSRPIESYKNVDSIKGTFARYLESLRDIEIKTDSTAENGVFLNELDELSLVDFMKKFVDEIEDYKCYLRLFQLLSNEYYKYNIPTVFDSKKDVALLNKKFCNVSDDTADAAEVSNGQDATVGTAKTTDTESEESSDYKSTGSTEETNSASDAESFHTSVSNAESAERDTVHDLVDEGCGFVIGLYYYCFRIIADLEHAHSTTSAFDRRSAYKNAYSKYDEIKNYLIRIIEVHSDRHLRRIVFRVLPYFEVLAPSVFQKDKHSVASRIVYVTMAELNSYGLAYCKPPKYNFLLYNNVNFEALDKEHEVYETTRSYRNHIEFASAKKPYAERNVAKGYLNVTDLYDAYERHSEPFYVYNDIILLKWSGEEMNIEQIHDNIHHTILRPNYYYAFSEIGFKYSVARIYYEIYTFRRRTFDDVYKCACNGYDEFVADLFGWNRFPRAYQDLMFTFKTYLTYFSPCAAIEESVKGTLAKYEREIEETLKNMGVLVYPSKAKKGVKLQLKPQKSSSKLSNDKPNRNLDAPETAYKQFGISINGVLDLVRKLSAAMTLK